MNDDEVMTAVRESVAGVHSATSVDQIMSRGRAMRARRRVPGVAGALAAAAGVALAAVALVPSGHPASHRPTAQLTAWTVAKQADGTVTVIIRDLRDPAGLQHKLRADGVRASVIFYPGRLKRGLPFRDLFRVAHNPCQEFSNQGQLLKVVTGSPPHPLKEGSIISVVHPAALPRGAGVQFIATSNVGYLNTPDARHALGVWLVQASDRCTGS
jgi:hypothetical protein